MVDVDSMIFGMLVMAVIIGSMKAVYEVTKFVIDHTYRNYTLIEFNNKGQKVTQKYTKKGYEMKFERHQKGGE